MTKPAPPRRPSEPETFAEYVGAVRPVARGSARVPPPRAVQAEHKGPRSAAPLFDVNDDGEHIEGVRRGFEDLLRDVTLGRLAIHDTLDLHGLRSEEAKRAALRFLKGARGRARRLVLVVHGRGGHSPMGRGILRDEMARWLPEPPFAEHVMCFATAAAKHGGAGALYVLTAPSR